MFDLTRFIEQPENEPEYKHRAIIARRCFDRFVGVIVYIPKMGIYAWRLWRKAPLDGETPLGRRGDRMRQWYVGGGYCLTQDDAIKFMVRANNYYEERGYGE